MKRSVSNLFTSHRIRNAIVVCIGLILCISLPSCSLSYTRPSLSVLPLQETYPQAKSIALNWQPDAQLDAVSFDIEFGNSPDRMHCSYAFLSAASHNYLMVFVNLDQSGYHFSLDGGPWPENKPIGQPIIFEEINHESKDALQAIMENGGSSFFERYRIRRMDSLFNTFSLELERLDENSGEGPLIWTGGFTIDNPHAQLYISVEDTTGDLLKVKAHGEKEQEYWLRDITVTERISIHDSINFFDYFDLRLDNITEEKGRRYADFTILSNSPGLILGEVTHTHVEPYSKFVFDWYEIQLVEIDREWIEVEIMPIVRWYKPTPTD
jgi:hypothetical protein